MGHSNVTCYDHIYCIIGVTEMDDRDEREKVPGLDQRAPSYAGKIPMPHSTIPTGTGMSHRTMKNIRSLLKTLMEVQQHTSQLLQSLVTKSMSLSMVIPPTSGQSPTVVTIVATLQLLSLSM